LVAVEGIDSAVSRRLRAWCCGRAVVLILDNVRAIENQGASMALRTSWTAKIRQDKLDPTKIYSKVRARDALGEKLGVLRQLRKAAVLSMRLEV
jgi:hypothetical protein